MAITTEGGSGIISGSEVLANTGGEAINRGSVTLFTTPTTSNSTFIVNISGNVHSEFGNVENGYVAVAGSSEQTHAVSIFRAPNSSNVLSATLKVGPGTSVEIVYVTKNASPGDLVNSPSFEYDFTYNYLGVVVS